jgi:hypothetical protein
VNFWIQHIKQTSKDWWMMAVLYVILNVVFAFANFVIIAASWASSRRG